MPVHFTVSDHDANPVESLDEFHAPTSSKDLLAHIWGRKSKTVAWQEILQAFLVDPDFSTMHAKHNGFVDTVISAYNEHHHLVLRPDDVWIAISGQLNF
ncbi:hypothetical protein CPB84DRAFT_1786686 [Gymnopilus junonius]|uniref:Uncharacterized protein n=1 Tax=Gymnopilus junonius TaxID=109634 RepID=A0A9P5NIV2_GYMJU|nr:hypothetical protein CPB84DRAFT_1786686 [Gymnopilus junonius]